MGLIGQGIVILVGKQVTLGMLESLLTSVAAAAQDGVPAAQSLDLVPECDPMPVSVRVLPSSSVLGSLLSRSICVFRAGR